MISRIPRQASTQKKPDPSDLAFVTLVLIFAIGLILLSIASGVQIDPEVVTLIHP